MRAVAGVVCFVGSLSLFACGDDGSSEDDGSGSGGTGGSATGGTASGGTGGSASGGSGGSGGTGGSASGGSASGGSASGGTGGSGSNCEACVACVDNACEDQLDACNADTECAAIYTCTAECGEMTADDCIAEHMDGLQEWAMVSACLNQNCLEQCQ